MDAPENTEKQNLSIQLTVMDKPHLVNSTNANVETEPTITTAQPVPNVTVHIDYAAESPRFLIGEPLGPLPTQMICIRCNLTIVTKVEKRISMRTHLISSLCCLVGGLLCMWIPYYVDKAKTKDHYCPNCEVFLGSGKEWPFIR